MFGGTVQVSENFNGFDFVNRHDVKVNKYLRQQGIGSRIQTICQES